MKALAILLRPDDVTKIVARFNPKPASPASTRLIQEVACGQQAAAESTRPWPLVTDAQLNR